MIPSGSPENMMALWLLALPEFTINGRTIL
jgi:hypothetical protein